MINCRISWIHENTLFYEDTKIGINEIYDLRENVENQNIPMIDLWSCNFSA